MADKLMECVNKNARISLSIIPKFLERSDNYGFSSKIAKKEKKYREILSSSYEYGDFSVNTPSLDGTEKIRTQVVDVLNSTSPLTVSHLAEIAVVESMVSVIELTRSMRQNPTSSPEAKTLACAMIDQEEKMISDMKRFL